MTFFVPLILIPLVIAGAIVLWGVATWNALKHRRELCDQVWSQLDQQWRRRADAIPVLVEALRDTSPVDPARVEALLAARAAAMTPPSRTVSATAPETLASRIEAEQRLTRRLRDLVDALDSNPAPSPAISAARHALAEIESRLALAAHGYNDAVAAYEEFRQAFPGNLLASAFSLPRRDYLQPATTDASA